MNEDRAVMFWREKFAFLTSMDHPDLSYDFFQTYALMSIAESPEKLANPVVVVEEEQQ